MRPRLSRCKRTRISSTGFAAASGHWETARLIDFRETALYQLPVFHANDGARTNGAFSKRSPVSLAADAYFTALAPPTMMPSVMARALYIQASGCSANRAMYV